MIGSAGSAREVAWLTDELGLDAAFNCTEGRVVDRLRKASPEGLDVYFDNVGGDHLEAALTVANDFAQCAGNHPLQRYR